MEYHVSTPAETQLVMQTEEGRVVLVLPAPSSSLAVASAHYGPPASALPARPHLGAPAGMVRHAAAAPVPAVPDR